MACFHVPGVTCQECAEFFAPWHAPSTSTFQFVVRAAWTCPRCSRVNAPHVDQCSCPAGYIGPAYLNPLAATVGSEVKVCDEQRDKMQSDGFVGYLGAGPCYEGRCEFCGKGELKAP